MPTYTNPGVYVSERPLRSEARRGNRSQSTAAFFGEAARGPEEATLISSWADYQALYGELDNAYDIGFAVYQYFANGGRDAYIVRVAAADAVTATGTVTYLPDGVGQSSATLFTVAATSPGAWGNGLTLEVTAGTVSATSTQIPTFNLTIKLNGSEVERWNEVSVDPNSNRYLETVVNTYSRYISVVAPALTADADWVFDLNAVSLANGSNGSAVADSDFTASLSALDLIEGVLILNAVGKTSPTVVNAFLTKAEQRGNSFVIIDPQADTVSVSDIGSTVVGAYTQSSFGAVYYPMLKMVDPSKTGPGAIRTTYPGGAVAGAYVRTEVARTVAKAPAGYNIEVRNAIGLATLFNASDAGTLYSTYNVNLFKSVPGAGIVINGARTLDRGTPGRFIPIRRSLNYLKQALSDATAFAVFEPNDERLWTKINVTVSALLADFWRSGGLKGANASQAFYVVCDETNNNATTISESQVHVEIGVALQYPAEFVIISISQWTGGANTVDTL
jgi:phage tail sheath protein FI